MPKLYNLVGQKIGTLTVIKKVTECNQGRILWDCICSCGKPKRLSTKLLNLRKRNNSGSCGCMNPFKGKNHPQWKGCGDFSAGWFHSHIIRGGKARVKVEVKINILDLDKLFKKQKGKCALSGLDLIVHNRSETNTASVDRIDSTKGYTKKNIQFVHKDINMMKRIYNQTYFIELCKLVTNYNKAVM